MALVGRFVLGVLTDAAFVPALVQVARRGRHFELFVGTMQLVSSLLFNLSAVVQDGGWADEGIFLRTLDWHFMSDVLTLTYGCCLLVHCMGNTSEDLNIVLRYVAFSFAWIFKLRDSWDSAVWEAMLVVAFAALTIFQVANHPPKVRARYDVATLKKGGLCLLAAAFFLALELAELGDAFGLLLGVVHCLGGATAFLLWKGIPTLDSKKDDDVLQKNSSFV